MNKQYRLKKDINKNIQFKRTKRVGSLGQSDKIQPFNGPYPTSETMLRNGTENESQTTVRPTMPVITAQHEPADTTTV
jgi:hypothetical protein